MTEPLLIESKRAQGTRESLESLEELAGAYERLLVVFEREVGRLLKSLSGSADEFTRNWQYCVWLVASGQTEKVQIRRGKLATLLSERLDLLRRLHRLAARGRRLIGEEAPDPDALLADIAGLERLKEGVFDRWQTPEDLEDLAARDYPLTTADLERLGPERQPPASWYEEESRPF
jgi:hypothetical protein